MPSPPPADFTGDQLSERGTLDALLTQARRLRGGVDAVRRGTVDPDGELLRTDPQLRWQRALCDLAVHHLDGLGGQLSQLREGAPTEPPATGEATPGPHPASSWPADPAGPASQVPSWPVDPPGPDAADGRAEAAPSLVGRVGSADWNLLTDEVTWSPELYPVFGRDPEDGPLSLDELPAWVCPEDHGALTAAVTDCLVDGRPIDGEFRVVRPDDTVRTVHLMGEPVLDADGGTASMWAVLRDVSELRRSEAAAGESRDTLQRHRYLEETERRVAVELQETVLPPWRGSLRLPHRAGDRAGTLELASHYLPSATGALVGGDWYDAMELPDGQTLLSVGDLTGHGVAATSGMALLLGALRGMSVAGVRPGALLDHLNQLLDSAAQPALGSAVCCRYDPVARSLTWSQAGHPAPLLFRAGVGRPLAPPEGVLLGATSGACYGERTEQLEPGDLLVLHTDGLAPRSTEFEVPGPGRPHSGAGRLLRLAPRFAAARTAQQCVREVVEEFGGHEREDDACVLIARVDG